jgi:Family of unknown function (DUF6166)
LRPKTPSLIKDVISRLQQGLKENVKTYTGYRLPGDQGTVGRAIVTVHEEGQEPRPLALRHDLRRHSEEFNWGYGGSGPAQLALALAADVLGDIEAAQDVYQRLKFQLVGRFARDGWSLTEDQLRQTIRDIQERDQDRSP